MNISIFYFSGTGNTWWVSKKIREKILKLRPSYKVNIYSIESDNLKVMKNLELIIEDSDIIGLGFPIHGSDAPDIVRSFVRTLPDENGKSVFLYDTQMTHSGNNTLYIKELIEEKGYIVKWANYFVMPCNLDLPQIVICKIPSESRKAKILKETEYKIEKFVQNILDSIFNIEGMYTVEKIFSYFSKGMFSIELPKYKKLLYVNEAKCTHCNDCVELCPVNNITVENSKIKFLDSCCLCLRCFNYCKPKAINMNFKFFNTEKSKRYAGPIKGFNPRVLRE
ncbi:MAG: EFR1 family ferrodoxin [Promethearchaeota archaeon]